MHNDDSLYKLGGICSVLAGISYLVIGLTEFLLSPELTIENSAQNPFLLFESNQVVLLTQYWAMGAGAICALAVIPAVAEQVRHVNEGWGRWTSMLATLGFAVTLLDTYWASVMTGSRATVYRTGDQVIRMVVTVPDAPQFIDVQGWLGYGAVGVWVLVVSLFALRSTVLPRLLIYVGIACSLGYFMVVASMVLPVPSGLLRVIAGVGVWYWDRSGISGSD